MIARVWKGWTNVTNADKYEALLRETIFPSFTKLNGYLGGTIFKGMDQANKDEIEFVITSYFASVDAIRAFSHEADYTKAVIEPEAQALLMRSESVANHFEVREMFQIKQLLD